LNQYSGELQFSGEALNSHLHFVSGFYAFKEDGKDTQFTVTLPAAQAFGLFFNSLNKYDIDNNALAAYGQATYDLNDIVSLTGGVRYTEEKKGFTTYGATIGSNVPTGPVLSVNTDATLKANFSHWTSMANVTLHAPRALIDGTPLNEGIVYFTFSQGFKSGGFNGEGSTALGNLTEFQPETLNSYEVGFKVTGLDRRLVVDADYYFSDYNNIQISALEASPLNGTVIQNVVNAARAHIDGVEIEATAYPLPHLELSGSLGTTHARYLEFNTFLPNGTPINASGVPFTRVPTYNSTLAMQYRIELGGAGTLTPRIEWNAYGVRHFSASPDSAAAIAAFTQGGYSLWNGRIALDLPDGRTQIAVFGRNLFDKHYMNDGIEFADSLSLGLAFFGAPRTVGVEINRKF